ncbi:MAG: PAS domain S-box protein [Burkholderiales bacterium]
MGFRLKFRNVRGELALFVAVLALPLLGLIAYGAYERARHDIGDAESAVRGHAEMAADRMRREVEEIRLVLEALARRPAIRAMDAARCDPALAEMLDLYPRTANVLLADSEGRVLCGAIPPPRAGGARLSEPALRAALAPARFTLVGPLAFGAGERPALAAVQPVRAGDGAATGALVMLIDPARWRPLPAAAALPEGSVIALLAGPRVIASSGGDADMIGRDVGDTEIYASVRAARQGTARARGALGVDRIWAFRAVPGTDWIALAGIDAESVLAPVRVQAARIAALIGSVLVAAGLLAVVYGERLARPIRDIAEAVRRRREGATDRPIPVGGPREIAAVAEELNRSSEARAQAERTLRESEERFRALWEASADAILMVDEQSIVRYANPAVLEVFGYHPEELTGQHLALVQPARLAGAHREGMARYLRTGERRVDWRSALTTGRRKDGREIPLEVSFSELRLEGRRYFAGFLADVSERERLSRERESLLARMQMQLERMPIVCLQLDRDLRISYANPEAERVLGWRAAELTGRRPAELYVPRDRHALLDAIFARLRKGEFVSAAGEAVRRDGARVMLEWVNTPLLDERGEFLGVMSMALDITERARAERRLRVTQHLFAALSEVNETIVRERSRTALFEAVCRICAEHIGFAVAFVSLVDADGRRAVPHVYAGPGAGFMGEAVFPLDASAPMGTGVTATAIRTGRAAIANDIDADPTRAAARTMRARIGSRAAASFPLFEGGAAIGALTVHATTTNFFDAPIVELLQRMADDLSFALDKLAERDQLDALTRELEDRVRRRTAELEAANQELEAFSYSVSHDLRAPVRHVAGFVRLLEKELAQPGAKAKHYLGTIAEAAGRMDALIGDLLTLSRTGRQPLRLQRVELAPLVRELIAQARPEAARRKVEWEIGELPAAMADPSLLRVVLQNLLANALKYTRPRRVARIAVEARPAEGGLIEVSVRDNGVGFDPRLADRLFSVFQRLHRDEEFEGTGIGLATARRIVHRHGQRIWGDGQPDAGAVFTFTMAAAETLHDNPKRADVEK